MIEHLFIVGAGFSSHAGLPLTSQFTEKLLDVKKLKLDGPSSLIVRFLQGFVEETFGHKASSDPKDWPDLEDIFTCVDLSANTGHHLGPKYSASDLRTVRRALIVRIIRMLRQTYKLGQDRADSKWAELEDFFSSVAHDKSAFLSMNWDTVIEEGLGRLRKIVSFDYGCDAKHVKIDRSSRRLLPISSIDSVQILKPHGSANWLYCDACRQVFWVPAKNTAWVADQLFKESDWKVIERFTKETYSHVPDRYGCPNCSASALGTRFATFSYRKALDFSMHERTWDTAERHLEAATNWIFIGYSLPAADYEFKLLLKRVQLSRRRIPKIVLVTGGSGAADTESSYKKFFGPDISKIFSKGLDASVQKYFRTLGAVT